jgi:hypothetical protein
VAGERLVGCPIFLQARCDADRQTKTGVLVHGQIEIEAGKLVKLYFRDRLFWMGLVR